MGLIEEISYNIASKIGKEANKTKDEIDIINYGLFMIIHTSIAIIITLIIGIIINKPLEMMIITIIASTLKRYSGGVHATSPNRCIIIGIVTSIICTYISVFIYNYTNYLIFILFSIVCMIFSYSIFYIKAPVGTKTKPLKNEGIRKRLRKKLFKLLNIYLSIILIIAILISNNLMQFEYLKFIYCLEMGILLQAISITKLGEVSILKIDSILIKKL